MTLKSSIRETESRIAERRSRISAAFDGVTDSVGRRMVSPVALVTAGLFGAFLHRDSQLLGARMLTLLETANTSMRLLLTLSSKIRPEAGTR